MSSPRPSAATGRPLPAHARRPDAGRRQRPLYRGFSDCHPSGPSCSPRRWLPQQAQVYNPVAVIPDKIKLRRKRNTVPETVGSPSPRPQRPIAEPFLHHLGRTILQRYAATNCRIDCRVWSSEDGTDDEERRASQSRRVDSSNNGHHACARGARRRVSSFSGRRGWRSAARGKRCRGTAPGQGYGRSSQLREAVVEAGVRWLSATNC
jgi:hypothetical protein